MSAAWAVRGNGWTWPRSRVALSAVLLSSLVLLGARVPASHSPIAAPSRLAATPIGLQSAVSAALGAEDSQFAIRARNGALLASSGGLSSVFGRSGPLVQAGHGEVGFQFAGIGYGAVARPAPAVPTASHNVVSYKRAGVSEWYRSGPLGLEQGFTVAHRPAGKLDGAWLTLAVKANGSLLPAKHGTEIVFGNSLRYSGLSAVDATGRSLPVRLGLHGRTLMLRVDDSDARYPLTIDPFIQQGSALTPSDESGAGEFGWSVALSSDGDTALIGAPDDSNGAGAAWVFTRSGSTWTQQGAKLTPNDEQGVQVQGGFFGDSVALSGDGSTALIGGVYDSGGKGAAWVFTRSGSTWTQAGSKLTASGSFELGSSVSLSADGTTALIGAGYQDDVPGGAWIFVHSGSTWVQQGAELTPSDEVGDGEFGFSTALSADGNTALIGGPADDHTTAGKAGAVWVFTRSGSTWTQQGAKLTPSDAVTAGSEFGYSVALSGDGNLALIGGPFDMPDGGNDGFGSEWLFSRSGTSWAQLGPKTIPGDIGNPEVIGLFSALSSDGTEALIGGLNHDGSPTGWVVDRSGATLTPDSTATTGALTVWPAGVETALSGDGSTVLIGAAAQTSSAGAAFVYTPVAVPAAPSAATATSGNGEATVDFTPSSNDGGAPISSYTVTASPGGASATGTGSPITVTGLTSGTSYAFTVTATNSAGTSLPSAPSNQVTPFTLAVGGSGGGGPGPPDLALTLTAPGDVAAGSQATFAFTVTDPDGMPDSNIHLLVTLPAGAVVDATSSDRGSGCIAGSAAGTLDCSLGFIYPPLVAHVTITLTLPTPGQATLTATVSGSQVEKNNANNTASATVQVDPTTTSTSPQPVVKKPAAPAVTIVGVETVHLAKPKLHLTLKVVKPTTVVVTLLGPNGKTVARWSIRLTPGTKHLTLALPMKARHQGRDKLRIVAGSTAKTVAVLIRSV